MQPTVIDLTDPVRSCTCTDPEDVTACAQLMGMSVPLALSIGFAVLGLGLMLLWVVARSRVLPPLAGGVRRGPDVDRDRLTGPRVTMGATQGEMAP